MSRHTEAGMWKLSRCHQPLSAVYRTLIIWGPCILVGWREMSSAALCTRDACAALSAFIPKKSWCGKKSCVVGGREWWKQKCAVLVFFVQTKVHVFIYILLFVLSFKKFFKLSFVRKSVSKKIVVHAFQTGLEKGEKQSKTNNNKTIKKQIILVLVELHVEVVELFSFICIYFVQEQ